MTPDQARAFLHAMGSKQVSKNGRWMQGSCPLAPVFHKHYKDSNPSFGLTAEPDKPSRYNCFACGHGSALELIQQAEFHKLNVDTGTARKILEYEQLEVIPLPGYGEFAVSEDAWMFKPWPELVLADLPSAHNTPAEVYAESRGIWKSQITKKDLRWDAELQMLVFPIREAYGQLAGARGRSVHEHTEGQLKHHDYSHGGTVKNVKGVWYNEPALNLQGLVVVVEGQIDCLKVEQVWPKVVANLTALPTYDKCLKLALTPGVVLIPDNDKTGVQSVAKYEQLLGPMNVPLHVLVLDGSVKDPGECHPEYLKEILRPYEA